VEKVIGKKWEKMGGTESVGGREAELARLQGDDGGVDRLNARNRLKGGKRNTRGKLGQSRQKRKKKK